MKDQPPTLNYLLKLFIGQACLTQPHYTDFLKRNHKALDMEALPARLVLGGDRPSSGTYSPMSLTMCAVRANIFYYRFQMFISLHAPGQKIPGPTAGS